MAGVLFPGWYLCAVVHSFVGGPLGCARVELMSGHSQGRNTFGAHPGAPPNNSSRPTPLRGAA